MRSCWLDRARKSLKNLILVTNIGVNIHSDMLCDLTKRNAQKQNGI